jgi:hypothetical protein
VMVIDKEIVITGSFYFTNAAEERNADFHFLLSTYYLLLTTYCLLLPPPFPSPINQSRSHRPDEILEVRIVSTDYHKPAVIAKAQSSLPRLSGCSDLPH